MTCHLGVRTTRDLQAGQILAVLLVLIVPWVVSVLHNFDGGAKGQRLTNATKADSAPRSEASCAKTARLAAPGGTSTLDLASYSRRSNYRMLPNCEVLRLSTSQFEGKGDGEGRNERGADMITGFD